MLFSSHSRSYFLCFSVIQKICVNDKQVWLTNSSCHHKCDKVPILVHFESFKKSPNCLNRDCKHETRYTHVHVCTGIIVCIILSWHILRMILFFMFYKCDAMRGSRKKISRRGGRCPRDTRVPGLVVRGGGGPRPIFGILLCKLNKFKLFRREPLPDPPSRSAHECVSYL